MNTAESYAKLLDIEEKMKDMAKKHNFDTAIMYNGKIDSHLNTSLILKQKLNKEEIEEIKRLHVIRLELFDYMRRPEVIKDIELLHECAKGMELIEYAMQKAWKFDMDVTKHNWWYRGPNCICPRMDHEERFGVGDRIIKHNGPCHGEI